jgi:hypothetical protein
VISAIMDKEEELGFPSWCAGYFMVEYFPFDELAQNL